MRFGAQRVACCLLCMGAAAWGQEQAALHAPASADPASFVMRRQVAEVAVHLAVTDRLGRSVSGITPEDLLVFDDGQPVSSVSRFEPNEQVPLRVALVIDWSDSMQREFKFEAERARDFLRGVLRPEQDRAMVVGFRARIEVTQKLTNDLEKLRKGVRPIAGTPLTSLYDAIVTACRAIEEEPALGPERRVLLLLSDGIDNYSIAGYTQALEAAQRANVSIYALAEVRSLRTEGQRTLAALADATGGRLIVVAKHPEQAFQRMRDELHSGYALYFKTPVPATGTFRSLEVRARNRNLNVRARRAYYTGGK